MKWITLTLVIISAGGNCQEREKEQNQQPWKREYIMAYLVEVEWYKSKPADEKPKEVKTKKPLKECIKPNNVIDDEVIKCMEDDAIRGRNAINGKRSLIDT